MSATTEQLICLKIEKLEKEEYYYEKEIEARADYLSLVRTRLSDLRRDLKALQLGQEEEDTTGAGAVGEADGGAEQGEASGLA